MDKRIKALTDHVVVCGAGTTGIHVVEELAAVDVPFVVIEADKSRLEKLRASADFPYIEPSGVIYETITLSPVDGATMQIFQDDDSDCSVDPAGDRRLPAPRRPLGGRKPRHPCGRQREPG